MAVDDEALEVAEVELTPGDVEWAEGMGRFKAMIKQLRLGGMARLAGLGLPLPDPSKDGFDVAVQGIFQAVAKQHAPLLPSRADAETTDAELDAPDAPPPKRLRTEEGAAPPPSDSLAAPADATPSSTHDGSDGGDGAVGAAAAGKRAARGGGGGGSGGGKKARTTAAPVQTQESASDEQISRELTSLVGQLQGVLAAKPLDEAAVSAKLDALERLEATSKQLEEACATRLVNKLRKSKSASEKLKSRAKALYDEWQSPA